MKHLKTFQLWETKENPHEVWDHSGNYETEDMQGLIDILVTMVDWNDGLSVMLPSTTGTATKATTPEELNDKWNDAVKKFGKDKDLLWYVWDVDAGGNFTKPKPVSSQRYDLNDIWKLRHSLRSLSIGMSSKETAKHDALNKDAYGKGGYSGD